MNGENTARTHSRIRRAAVATAALLTLGVVALWSGAAGAATDEPVLDVSCEQVGFLLECTVKSDRALDTDQGVIIPVTADGSTHNIVATPPGTSNNGPETVVQLDTAPCSDSEGVCYRFSIAPGGSTAAIEIGEATTTAVTEDSQGTQNPSQQQAVSQQDGVPSQGTAESCVDKPQLPGNPTCVERPNDANATNITPTQNSIIVEDDESTTEHDGAQDDIPSGVDVQFHDPNPDLVDDVENPDGPVIVNAPKKYDADGNRNHDAETNQARIEQALHEAGTPYIVCFPEETITFYDEQTGEPLRTVTFPEECVEVTP